MARKRKGLDALGVAATAKSQAEGGGRKVREEMVTTAVHIPVRVHEMLRAVAFRRAKESRGRVNVSRLIVGLVDLHWEQLKEEAGIYYIED